MKTFSITDVGMVRQVNQDYVYTTDNPLGPLPNLFVVADGMGGHQAGDYASKYTVEVLKRELEQINALGWQADEAEILGWTGTEGYPVDGQIQNGKLTGQGITEHTVYNTESLAKFAFSILWKAAGFSLEKRVPILLDF